MVGKEILGYHVDEKIGSGGFGTVYKVSKTNAAGTYVRALKHVTLPTKKQYASVLNSMGGNYAKADDYFAGVLRDIVSEIQILSTLSESGINNIVRYYENDIVETQSPRSYDIYILMEFLTPFPDYFDSRTFTVRDVIALGRDILSALISCHGKNIIHRDIKDDNIFVSPEGVYKLGDFGVSKALKDKSRAESVKGTPNFIAPEVYLGKEKYDNTVDVYSLGIVLYKLLNKSRNPFMPPFPAAYSTNDEDAAFEARMRGEIPELPHSARNELGQAVVKAIMPRAGRYNSAAEFLNALNAAEQMMSAAQLDEVVNVVMPGGMPHNRPTGSMNPSINPSVDPAGGTLRDTLSFTPPKNSSDLTVGMDYQTGRNDSFSSNDDLHLFDTFAAPPPNPNANSGAGGGPVPPFNPPPSGGPNQSFNPPPPSGGPNQPFTPPSGGNSTMPFTPSPGGGPSQPYNPTPPPGGGPNQPFTPNPSGPSAGAPPQQFANQAPKVKAVDKKGMRIFAYLSPVIIAIIYLTIYAIIVPIVYRKGVSIIKWLFSSPNILSDILHALEEPGTIINPILLIIGFKILNWVLILAFIASLFWVGYTIQHRKPDHSIDAIFVDREPYIYCMDLNEQIKNIQNVDVSIAERAVYSLCERLRSESAFGSGSQMLINCENEIANSLKQIEANIPGLRNPRTVDAATGNIQQLCDFAIGKLKIRMELKIKRK